LPMWIGYMGRVLRDSPPAVLPQPPGLVTVRINPDTGQTVQGAASSAIYETFYDDNIPEAEPAYANGAESEGSVVEDLF